MLADFARLTPDRLALVTRGERGDTRIVEVYGHLPEERSAGARAGDVRVALQHLPTGADDDLGWLSAEPAPPPPGGGRVSRGGLRGEGGVRGHPGSKDRAAACPG